MPLLESTDALQRPADKHPRGACYWAVFWADADRQGFESFERAVADMNDLDNLQAWLGKCNELGTERRYQETVVERIRELGADQ